MDAKAMNDWLDSVEKKLDGSKTDVDQVKARMLELEQKAARPRGSNDNDESIGAQFVKHMADLDGVSHASAHGRRASFGLEVKATVTSGSTSGGPIGRPAYRDDVVPMPRRRLMVRDLLNVVQIDSGSVEYPKQTTRTNNAAPVAEGALKPESAYGFTMQTWTPKVIAHWIPASRQILDDAPQLRGMIDGELLYGLALREDAQLLLGDGTGENLTGMVPAATAFTAPIVIADATMIDKVGLSILQGTLADYTPNGIVVHPSDWMLMRLLKNADGEYILGDPAADVVPRLFGLPVVPTTSMALDSMLVGDFAAAATLYDRWTPRIEVATEHADFFVRNMVAILAEERIALAIKQPGALIYSDFGNVT